MLAWTLLSALACAPEETPGICDRRREVARLRRGQDLAIAELVEEDRLDVELQAAMKARDTYARLEADLDERIDAYGVYCDAAEPPAARTAWSKDRAGGAVGTGGRVDVVIGREGRRRIVVASGVEVLAVMEDPPTVWLDLRPSQAERLSTLMAQGGELDLVPVPTQ